LDHQCYHVRIYRFLCKNSLLTTDRDAKDPRGQTEQILAIAPILPGQKVNPEYNIPPHAPSSPIQNNGDHHQRQQKSSAPPSIREDDLIDFGDSHSNANANAVSANQRTTSSPNRKRSVSLMDDDRHINAMNDKMAGMQIVNPNKPQQQPVLKTPAPPPQGKEQPLERTDTQTSEVDAFFDAEG
jgi:hypothetical protein